MILALILMASMQQAPVATPLSKLAWDMPAPDLASAQAYVYRFYPDGATTGNAFTAVTCAGTTSPFQCETAFPSFSQGNHTLRLTASNVAGEGIPSDPFAFAFVISPNKITNIHIK